MKKYLIASDLHHGAPHAVHKEFQFPKTYMDCEVILLGDIVDMSNCPKQDVAKMRMHVLSLKRSFGANYIYGNHECDKPMLYYIKKDNVLFCHGHTLFWNENKVKKWETDHRVGRSWWRYKLYSLKHKIKRSTGKKLYPSNNLLDKCEKLCTTYDCDTIVFGHTHKEYDVVHGSIRIVNVPQGLTRKVL